MPEGPTGAPDWGVLDALSTRATTHPLLASVVRDREASELVVTVAPKRYPDRVERATLAVTWYVDDCYRFHYRERHADGTVWQCRWDRHPNPHAAERRFHRPPAGGAGDVVDDPNAPAAPEDALTRVLAAVRDRIDDLWRDDTG
jgi:hypothetical protein